jgi:hypothetical protein
MLLVRSQKQTVWLDNCPTFSDLVSPRAVSWYTAYAGKKIRVPWVDVVYKCAVFWCRGTGGDYGNFSAKVAAAGLSRCPLPATVLQSGQSVKR